MPNNCLEEGKRLETAKKRLKTAKIDSLETPKTNSHKSTSAPKKQQP
jgi:hypothetical protein